MIVDDTSQIEGQLSTIFNSKKSKWTSLAGRRDVINKTILRGFKKFFVNLFESNSSNKNESSKQIKSLSAGESGAWGYLTEESVPNLQEDLIHCFWLISDIFGTRHVKYLLLVSRLKHPAGPPKLFVVRHQTLLYFHLLYFLFSFYLCASCARFSCWWANFMRQPFIMH